MAVGGLTVVVQYLVLGMIFAFFAGSHQHFYGHNETCNDPQAKYADKNGIANQVFCYVIVCHGCVYPYFFARIAATSFAVTVGA